MQGKHMDFFYLAGGAAVLLMTFLLHRFGNAWIDRLYASHRDILTFPLAVKERGRLRRFLLPLASLRGGRASPLAPPASPSERSSPCGRYWRRGLPRACHPLSRGFGRGRCEAHRIAGPLAGERCSLLRHDGRYRPWRSRGPSPDAPPAQEAQERLRLWPVLCAHCAYSLPDAERVTGGFSRLLSHRRIPVMRTYSKTAYKEKWFDRQRVAVYD